MLGELNVPLKSVVTFSETCTPHFTNPAFAMEPAIEGLTCVALDNSASMREKEIETKIIVSALKCMSQTTGMWNLPEPRGGTALVDAIDHILKENPGVERIILISDGMDNASKRTSLIHSIHTAPDGTQTIEYRDMPPVGHVDRSEAVAKHVANIGVELFLVGVGTEVKEFIKTCEKGGRINTAFVEKNASAEDVGAVLATVLKRPRSNPGNKTTVTTSTAEKISSGAVDTVREEAKRTTSHHERKINSKMLQDGPQFDPVRQTEYIQFIVDHQVEKHNLRDFSTKKMTAIVMWFRKMVAARNGAPLAGALIAGRRYPKSKYTPAGGIVFDLCNTDPWSSKWIGCLRAILEDLSHEPFGIVDKINGLSEKFSDDFQKGLVGPVFADVGMAHASCIAITKKDVPQIEKTTYFKFKKNTYVHYLVNSRMLGPKYDVAGEGLLSDLLETLVPMPRGNSSAESYGGPVVEELPVESDDMSETVSADETVSEEENANLKRKIWELEEENTYLRSENEKLKRMKSAVEAALGTKDA
jgi:hypothetical protein